MARNRFENYINSGYTSQFTPTPLDAGMLYNVAKERQSYYDQLDAQLAQLEPKFNYIKATDYDMGHTREANEVKNYYKQTAEQVAQALQDDNLEGAKSTMLKSIYNKDMRTKIAGLEAAYLQDEENRKTINTEIKDIGDQQRSLNHYYQNRLKDRNFNDYLSGKANALGSPILGDNPGLDSKINSIGAAIHANGYPIGDGRVLRALPGPNGKEIYKMYSQDGKETSITYQDAMGIISTGILADPQVQDYVRYRHQTGDPILEFDKDGKPIGGQLMQMINAQANARSFVNRDVNTHIIDDSLELARAKGEIADPYAGSVERPAAKNPNIKTQSQPGDWKVENGKVYRKNKTPLTEEQKRNAQEAAARSGGMAIDLPMNEWEEYKPTPEEMKSFKEDFVKLINTKTGEATIVTKNSPMIPLGPSANATDYVTQEIGDAEILSAMAGFEQSMQNVSWTTTAPTDTKPKKANQLAAKGIHSVQYRETGEDGTVSYKTKKIGEVGDIDFYQGGYTLTHPEYKSGHEVFYGEDVEGNQYEAVSNTKNQNPAFGVIDGINEWALSLDTKPHAQPVGNNLYAVSEKSVELSQSSNGTFSTGKTPGITVIMVEAASPEEAVQNYKTRGYNPVTFGQFTEELYKNNSN